MSVWCQQTSKTDYYLFKIALTLYFIIHMKAYSNYETFTLQFCFFSESALKSLQVPSTLYPTESILGQF